ncbi:MAG: YihY/virulence factor BrkB family protein [Bdellovibrio sp.]|nr:YihY/virulence factor BrkB family protein [Bdellovibrio sp.]
MELRKNLAIFIDRFTEKHTTTWASSLAFYTALSLAPLLVLFLIVSSQLSPDLQNNFLSEVNSLMGSEAATTMTLILQNAKSRPDLTSFSGLISLATLLLSASLIFGELRAALNSIFHVETVVSDATFLKATWLFIKARIFQMGLVLGFLFIIIVSLVASTIISSTVGGSTDAVGVVINILASAGIYIFLFSVLFHFIPEKRLPWKRSVQGSIITAFLFIIGKELISIYLGHSAISSSYGAAGSLVVLLAWVYYSAMIIFVGAHISYMLHSKDLLKSEALKKTYLATTTASSST